MPTPVDPNTLVAGTTASAAAVEAKADALYTYLTGNLDDDAIKVGAGINLADKARSADLDKLGLSSSAVVRRGKTNIPAEESRTNTSFGLLSTPDRVSSLVLPTDGLIVVLYDALWRDANAGAEAAIFIGSNQLKARASLGILAAQAAAYQENTLNIYRSLLSFPLGLTSIWSEDVANPDPVTTGQAVAISTLGAEGQGAAFNITGAATRLGADLHAGGPCFIFAAAGTYDVSVQFRHTIGGQTVFAKHRKLWVWTMGF